MKPISRALFLFIFLFNFVNAVYSQSIFLKQTHENGVYKIHDKISISALLSRVTNDSLTIKVWKNNDQLIYKKTILPDQDSLVIFESTFKEPCSVIIEARKKDERKLIGAIVSPNKLKPGLPRPKDFEAYWNQEKQSLGALMMEVKTKKMDIGEPGYECQDIEINCTGSKPARGYFAKPVGAKVRSLPIVLIVHAAGVKGSWCRSEVANAMNYAKKGKGALCFDLNAHGMLNGQPDEYYNNLEAGELKEYYVRGVENREEVYFRSMYLRLIRTIEFLTRQPEWDKKRIIVIGESQGGGQALAAAGLDSRVSAVVATVPAMCDWGGTLVGRKGGWPQPFEHKFDQEKMKQALPYFDTANLLKNSNATIVVEIGLVDQTCPSTSIYAAINQAKGDKIIFPVTYREHSWPTAEQRKSWDPMVFNPKNEFVDNYLK
jgi:cephalosporin-C deacetylase-like acetyl esterase